MRAKIQLEPTEVFVTERKFYIFPFPAFKGANLSGELISLLTPMLTSLAPLMGVGDKSVLDVDIEQHAPAIGNAFNAVSGDKLEVLLKKLLVKNQNISVEIEGDYDDDNGEQWLTEDLVNELFCGNVQDMFVLAFHVIKVNYSGFFEKLGGQSGKVVDKLKKLVNTTNTGI